MRQVNRWIVMLCLGLAVAACGRKEPPRVVDTHQPPHLTSLEHSVEANSLVLSFVMQGGGGGLGYQIDRAELDPHCNCPSMWRRFLEQPALPRQVGVTMTRNINIHAPGHVYFFRIRAVDSLGNLGEWSKTIRAEAKKVKQ
jgi:predicted small lipoprotein YifL